MRKFIMQLAACLFFISGSISLLFAADDYGIKDLTQVSMFFRNEGAHSPYKFVEAVIKGDGQARVSFQRYGYQPKEQKAELSKEEVLSFIQLYTAVDFLNLKKSPRSEITQDVGKTTISYRYKAKEKTLIYTEEDVKPLSKLKGLFWKLIYQEIMLSDINASGEKKTEDVNLWSIIEADLAHADEVYLQPEKVKLAVGEYLLESNLAYLDEYNKNFSEDFGPDVILNNLKAGRYMRNAQKLIPGLITTIQALKKKIAESEAEGVYKSRFYGDLQDATTCLKLLTHKDFGDNAEAWSQWYKAKESGK